MCVIPIKTTRKVLSNRDLLLLIDIAKDAYYTELRQIKRFNGPTFFNENAEIAFIIKKVMLPKIQSYYRDNGASFDELIDLREFDELIDEDISHVRKIFKKKFVAKEKKKK